MNRFKNKTGRKGEKGMRKQQGQNLSAKPGI